MKIWRTFRIALYSLVGNKLRTTLAVLGIVIGVCAVVVMIAMGRGAQEQVSSSVKGLGTNLLYIRPGMASGQGHVRRSRATTLTVQDIEAVRLQVPEVAAAAPEVSRTYQVKFLENNYYSEVVGTNEEYQVVRDFYVEHGRYFSAAEIQGRARVAVLGAKVVKELFPNTLPLDKMIKIDGKNFAVIGIMEEKGGAGWFDPDEQILVPYTTAMERLLGERHLRNGLVSIGDAQTVDAATKKIESILLRRHRIEDPEKADFTIRSQTDWLNRLNQIMGAFTLLLGGIASISLLVGGIGIMNIMLVSVTERTREIGIRKALGAKRSDILKQFLVESVVITLFGGGIGLAIAYFACSGVPKLEFWRTLSQAGPGDDPWIPIIGADSVGLALGFCVFVGVFFGLYPAWKASRMNPVDALRYE